ncbi:MAG: aspartate kinase [Clostridia bacterium]|nr:aspartate kinase [Clostridia bacterium]MBR6135861.1 aspartate kinase [Clostridia bacterium]
MGIKVVKFGGSSLADAGQMRKVKDIVQADPERRYVIPSAPGKSPEHDIKITDLLYTLENVIENGGNHEFYFNMIRDRFIGIRDELGLTVNIEGELDHILERLLNGAGADYAASRGEYLNGLLLAEYLGYAFIDAAEVILFDKRGRYDETNTEKLLSKRLKSIDRAVIPGFYGSLPNGNIKTFSRGGSDITGSIVAASVRADLYENWTDVSGFYMVDPRLVPDPGKVESITYRELRELSYMGASVLHEDSIFPVYKYAIPINVRNTNEPSDPGTMIVPSIENFKGRAVTGIAGKKNFTIISIEKTGMNAELGFGRRVLASIEKYGIPFEHMPSSIDSLCVVLEDSKVRGSINDIIDDIHRSCEPDSVEIINGIALIATVGKRMRDSIGTAAKLFSALAEADINVRMIDQGSSEINIIIGVKNEDFERAVIAIHNAFRDS